MSRVESRSLSVPQLLLLSAAASFALVFAALLAWGRPGLGLGQGFSVPIILVGLATGPLEGALAGVVALGLYETGLLLPARETWSDVASAGTAIRLVAYVSAGLLVGYFATLGRRLLAEALHALDDLFAIAKRDSASGAFTAHGLEAAINRRLALRGPFGLLVGNAADRPDVRAAARVAQGDDVARLGGRRLAVLTLARDPERSCAVYERALAGSTFGWARHPEDGADALSLYDAALERLHARSR